MIIVLLSTKLELNCYARANWTSTLLTPYSLCLSSYQGGFWTLSKIFWKYLSPMSFTFPDSSKYRTTHFRLLVI